MDFKVGEEIELIADNGHSCGKFIIDEISSNSERVWFKNKYYNSAPCLTDLIRRCRKIIKPGDQLLFNFM